MTILNKFLIFNKPVQEIECDYCHGSGKKRTSSIPQSTMLFSFFIGVGLTLSFLHIFKDTSQLKNYIIFGSFLLLSILALMEIEQTKVAQNEKTQ